MAQIVRVSFRICLQYNFCDILFRNKFLSNIVRISFTCKPYSNKIKHFEISSASETRTQMLNQCHSYFRYHQTSRLFKLCRVTLSPCTCIMYAIIFIFSKRSISKYFDRKIFIRRLYIHILYKIKCVMSLCTQITSNAINKVPNSGYNGSHPYVHAPRLLNTP